MSAEKLEPRPAGQIPAGDAHEHSATSIPRFYKTSQECHFYTGPGEKFSFGRINFVAIRKQAYNGSASTSESHLKGSQSRL